MNISPEVKRRWFRQGAAAWRTAQGVLGVSTHDATADLYACPLCIEINHSERRARFRLSTESALSDGSLTVQHVPPESFGGQPLLLTCRVRNNTAGTALDAHARKRENPRDAFLGRVTAQITMTAGGHRLPASFTLEEGKYQLAVPKKKHAYRPDAELGFRRTLAGPEGSDRDIALTFHRDAFDDDRARVSWLRSAYLTVVAVAGYRVILGEEMEIVRRQINEPKVAHIPTFLIDTGGNEDWSERAFVRIRTPEWQRCWGIRVGHFVVCVPLPGDTGLYARLEAARRDGTEGMIAQADAWEWPTRPSFGMPFADTTS